MRFGYGIHPSPVRTNRALLAHATGRREFDQPQCSECHPVRGRARLQVARASQAVRQLTHGLYAHEPLEQERCARPGVRATAASPQIVRIKIEPVSLDSTIVKVHPDGTRALKKGRHSPSVSSWRLSRPTPQPGSGLLRRASTWRRTQLPTLQRGTHTDTGRCYSTANFARKAKREYGWPFGRAARARVPAMQLHDRSHDR